MTLAYMEGFETVIDNTDMTSRGWKMGGAVNLFGQNALSLPSRTGVAGRGLMLRGPYGVGAVAGWQTALPLGGTSGNAIPDFGMIDTGASIHNLWLAGGFSVGFNATFNKANQVQIATLMPHQICYDGAQYYWAIAVNNAGTTCVAYSTDLINWTVCQNVPPNLNSFSSITVLGSGPTATVIVGVMQHYAISTLYYSTNLGLSWNATAAAFGNARQPVLTGNGATPIVFSAQLSGGAMGLWTMASLGATPVAVAGLTLAPNTSYFTGVAKLVAGIACFSTSSSSSNYSYPAPTTSYWVCCPVSKDMTAAANYVQSQSVSLAQQVDITFFNNTWISVGTTGIHTAPNSGTVGTPAGPTAAWAAVPSIGSWNVYSVDNNGTICVAVGQDPVTGTIGAIWTTTDGVNWTKANRFIFQSSVSPTNSYFTNVFWDGKQFVLSGGANNNVVATSPDGLAWTPTYYPDYTEYSVNNPSFLGIFGGTLFAGANAGGSTGNAGTFAGWGTAATHMVGLGLFVGAPTTNAAGTYRTVQGTNAAGTGALTNTAWTVSVPTTPLTHFYEIIATTVPGTVNAFTYQLAIDGQIVNSIAALAGGFLGQLSPVSDTTGLNHLLINLPRCGNFVMIDDIYVSTFNGANNVGQLGPVNIVPWTPTSDVANPMTRQGAAASNAAQVAGALSLSEGGVYTYTTGAKDIYKTSNGIPAGYKIKAVQGEAYFTKFGTSGASCNMGIVSGSTEVDSANVAAVTINPTYASLTLETDPNTSAAWTTAGANAAELSVTKAN